MALFHGVRDSPDFRRAQLRNRSASGIPVDGSREEMQSVNDDRNLCRKSDHTRNVIIMDEGGEQTVRNWASRMYLENLLRGLGLET